MNLDCNKNIRFCKADLGSDLNNDKNKGVILPCGDKNGKCEVQRKGQEEGIAIMVVRIVGNCN